MNQNEQNDDCVILCWLFYTVGTHSNVFGQAMPPAKVDCSTLTGKAMCGYQGWFNCEGDGKDGKTYHVPLEKLDEKTQQSQASLPESKTLTSTKSGNP